MPRITRAEVERVAALARLALEPQEALRMAGELDAILDYVEALAAVDTQGVEPTSHVIDLATPMREDRAEPPLDPELAVANAPERDATAFLVPKVIETDEEG